MAEGETAFEGYGGGVNALEDLPVTCPSCGVLWILHNYAVVSVAAQDRFALCPDCMSKKKWAERMLQERDEMNSD